MEKSRPGYGRSRTTPRGNRRTAVSHDPRMLAARRVAEEFIATRWPQLAGVSPSISVRQAAAPDPKLLARLGIDSATLARHGATHYTFIFSGTHHTADGAEAPMAAAVTVDEHQKVVKTSVTR